MSWALLPSGILSTVGGFLSCYDFANCRSVCTKWRTERASWERLSLFSNEQHILNLCIKSRVLTVEMHSEFLQDWLDTFENIKNLSLNNVTEKVLQELSTWSKLRDVALTLLLRLDPGGPWDSNWLYLRLFNIEQMTGIMVITDQALRSLKSDTIRRLSLYGNYEVTDEGMVYVGQMKNLISFKLSASPVTTNGLQQLSSLTMLQYLYLGRLPVSAKAMECLTTLTSLKYLHLIKCGLMNESLGGLAKVVRLLELYIEDCAVTDVSFLENIIRLETLSLRKTSVESLAPLRFLVELRNVDLSNCKCVISSSLQYLSAMKNLRTLNLENCTQIADDDIFLLRYLTALEKAHFSECSLTDMGLAHLHRLTALRDLHINSSNVTDAGVRVISRLHSLQNLTLQSAHITDEGIAMLCHLRDLSYLNLHYCRITSCADDPFGALDFLTYLVLPTGYIRRKRH